MVWGMDEQALVQFRYREQKFIIFEGLKGVELQKAVAAQYAKKCYTITECFNGAWRMAQYVLGYGSWMNKH